MRCIAICLPDLSVISLCVVFIMLQRAPAWEHACAHMPPCLCPLNVGQVRICPRNLLQPGRGFSTLTFKTLPRARRYINAPVVWEKGEGRRSKSLCRAGDRIPWRFWERGVRCVCVGCRVEIKQRYSKRCPRVFFLNVRYIYATRSLTLILSGVSAAARSPPVGVKFTLSGFVSYKKNGGHQRAM